MKIRMGRRELNVPLNWIDRAVNYVSPSLGLKRARSRAVMALAGGYAGGQTNRRQTTSWRPGGADADSDIMPDLEMLRERSRDLCRNAPLAAGAINTKVTSIVGAGLRLHPRIDREVLGLEDEAADGLERQIVREFGHWARHCDYTRGQTFWELQSLVFRQVLENGDVFILLPFKEYPGSPYGTKLQLVEADRVINENNVHDTPTLSGGVEKDAGGVPLRYHILKGHPGNVFFNNTEWTKVDAFQPSGRPNVIHLFDKRRPGQSRGVPDLAPVIETLKQLDKYTEAEIMAAVISSMFTVFVKTEGGGELVPMAPTSEVGGKTTDEDYKLGVGAMIGLAGDESVEFANPSRPNTAFDPFVLAILRQIGVALELPYEILIKHFAASYSASKGALMEAWRFFRARRYWLANRLCDPVYAAFFEEAVARGRIAAPGFIGGDPIIREAYLGADWIGPGRGQLDELKEAKAIRERLDVGLTTLEMETAEYNGGDWERNHTQQVKELTTRTEAGLGAAAADSGDVTGAPAGSDEETGDGED